MYAIYMYSNIFVGCLVSKKSKVSVSARLTYVTYVHTCTESHRYLKIDCFREIIFQFK